MTDTTVDVRDNDVPAAERDARLARTWGTGRGFLAALSTVDHKIIGRRYIITAFVFLALGGVSAIIMRVQLARAENTVVGPDFYNQLFTVHGSTMMFLFAVPVMEAFAIYLVRSATGSFYRAAFSFGCVFWWTRGRTRAGSPTCRWQAPNSRRENGPTSGRK